MTPQNLKVKIFLAYSAQKIILTLNPPTFCRLVLPRGGRGVGLLPPVFDRCAMTCQLFPTPGSKMSIRAST